MVLLKDNTEVILSSKKNFEPASSQVAVSKPLECLQLKFVTIKKGKRNVIFPCALMKLVNSE